MAQTIAEFAPGINNPERGVTTEQTARARFGSAGSREVSGGASGHG